MIPSFVGLGGEENREEVCLEEVMEEERETDRQINRERDRGRDRDGVTNEKRQA